MRNPKRIQIFVVPSREMVGIDLTSQSQVGLRVRGRWAIIFMTDALPEHVEIDGKYQVWARFTTTGRCGDTIFQRLGCNHGNLKT